MIKIMVVFGTRPEAIKMCPLINELKRRALFETVVCVSGQHKEMLSQVLDFFNVKPDYDLCIMKESQTLFDITENVLEGMKRVLELEKPKLVLVHGDTSTAFSTALAAFYLKIPVGHVEAGLRTYNIYSPYPEEFNRQGISSISSLHFAPTKLAAEHLIAEGKKQNTIFVTGNTVIDALSLTVSNSFSDEVLSWVGDSKLVLMTSHRRENIGAKMESCFKGIRKFVEENQEIKLVYPVHPNPSVRRIADSILGNCERIKLINPIDVFTFHNYISRSFFVITDSGGIQEEAPSFKVPVLVMRDETERPEGVEAGVVKLIGTTEEKVYSWCTALLKNVDVRTAMCSGKNPFGDGHASERIADAIAEYFVKKDVI